MRYFLSFLLSLACLLPVFAQDPDSVYVGDPDAAYAQDPDAAYAQEPEAGFRQEADSVFAPSGTYLYAVKDTLELYLDVYEPAEGAETTFQGREKPTILFAFGGGFISGHRDDAYLLPWFRLMIEDGYRVVAIDYRLGMKGYKVGKGLFGAAKASNQFLLSQQMGVEDVYSAVSFLAENRRELGVDMDNIVLAGNSAGAIIALAAEYDIVRGVARGLPTGFQFKGVMSFAGAIISVSGAPKYPAQPCATAFFHGTADGAVAYNHYGFMGRGIWGSDYIVRQFARKHFDDYCIYRFPGRTHDVAAYMTVLWDIEKEFLEQNVILGTRRVVDTLIDDPSLPTWNPITLKDIY